MNERQKLDVANSEMYNMLIKDLAKDGVLCNPGKKEYDERGTFAGGAGSRSLFKYYNDKIIHYHHILSVLKGEQRANITEAIPVIDFLHMENTSLLYTYEYTDETCSDIDPTSIIAIPNAQDFMAQPSINLTDINNIDCIKNPEAAKNSEVQALAKQAYDMLLDEDPYILNRAVMGHPLREHFYNTSFEFPEEPNILASSYTGSYDYIYKGIKTREIVDMWNNKFDSSRSTEIQIATLLSPRLLEYTTAENTSSGAPEMGYRDAQNILFPTQDIQVGETSFIRKINGNTYSLNLLPEDIVILIPGALYSADSNKFILFKKNPSYVQDDPDAKLASDKKINELSTEELEKKYIPFIFYIDTINCPFTLEIIKLNDPFPSYTHNDYIMSILQRYLKIDKEYYAEASGLLNGYFCMPASYGMASRGSCVTKWVFNNDVDKAKEKEVIIDTGSKYNPSHLLGRGNPVTSPLKLTENDKKYDDWGLPYKGKATFIYDSIMSKASKLFETVQIPFDQWGNFNLCMVDSVMKKADYVNRDSIPAQSRKNLLGTDDLSTIDAIQYPNKLRNNGNPLQIKDLQDYFEEISSCVTPDNKEGTSYTLNLDVINNSDVCCYDIRIRENSTFFNFGWATHTSETRGTGNSIATSFKHTFYAKWDYRYKWKRKKTVTDCENLSVKVFSPINVFSKKKSDISKAMEQINYTPWLEDFYSRYKSIGAENTILIYPEWNKILPSELYLLSRINLGLEPFSPPVRTENQKFSRGLCSFVYPPRKGDTKGKVISFRVDKVYNFLPSKIRSISINDPYSGHVIHRNISEGSIPETEDCYIYILKPMYMSMEGIEIYDWQNRKIETADGVSDVMLMPMAYPSNYFPVTPQPKAVDPDSDELPVEYVIDASHRSTDINYLENSYIIPGVPQFTDPEQLRTLKKNNVDLSIFADLFGEGVGSLTQSALKQGISYVLNNWPLSDNKKNPIELHNMVPILEGLIDIKPHLYDLIEGGFKMPVGTETIIDDEGREVEIKKKVEVTVKDLDNFFKRIDKDTKYEEYGFKIKSMPSDINITNEGGQNIDFDYTQNHNLDFFLSQKELLGLGNTGGTIQSDGNIKGTYSFLDKNGVVHSEETPSSIPSQCFGKTSNIVYSYDRPSLKTLSKTLQIAYGGEEITRQGCQMLDIYFGNDTPAFLELGDPLKGNTTPETIITMTQALQSNIEQIIIDTDIAYKNSLIAGDIKDAAERNYNIFFRYYDNERWNEISYPEWFYSYDPCLMKKYKFDSSTSMFKHPEIYYESINSNGSLRGVINDLRSNIWKHSFWRWGWVYTWRKTGFNKFLSIMNFGGSGPAGRNWRSDGWLWFWVPSWTRRSMRNYLMDQIYNECYSIASDKTHSDAEVIKNKYGKLEHDTLEKYLFESDYMTAEEEIVDNDLTKAKTIISLNLPKYDQIYHEETQTAEDGSTSKIKVYDGIDGTKLIPSGTIVNIESPEYDLRVVDISMEILQGISDYVEQQLEGTGKQEYYVRFLPGDKKQGGREDSLYYKRYKYLNARLNTQVGTLFNVGRDFNIIKNNKQYINSCENSSTVYDTFMQTIPVYDINPLKFFPPQEATATTLEMEGKFYYQDQLDTFRNAIGDKCILTCNSCPVKDSCPFYNEKELIKLYCPEAQYIEFNVKDNFLDLIVYDKDSPHLETSDGAILNPEDIKVNHKVYSDILSKSTGDSKELYGSRSLEAVRMELNSSLDKKVLEKDLRGGIGWLNGARYGTVEKNPMRSINLGQGHKATNVGGMELPEYNLMYNAMFISDEKSEVAYVPSKESYKVTLERYENGIRRLYQGETRLYIPSTLNIFLNASNEDDVYLISDDDKDTSGNPIKSIIYLNTVGNLRYTFDLQEDLNSLEIGINDIKGGSSGLNKLTNGHVYAKDVAQWCINVAKGVCAGNPQDKIRSLDGYDQYWMPTIRKKVYDEGKEYWVEIPGRSRRITGSMITLVDENEMDKGLIFSGKPTVAPYVDFTRKFMINMKSILWVKPHSKLDTGNYDTEVTRQKSVLPYMKTNLRLVVVKNLSHADL